MKTTEADKDQDTIFNLREEDLEAYARIFNDTISGISAALAGMVDTLASLQGPGSDNERRLMQFSTFARDISLQRESLEKMLMMLIKNKNNVISVCNLIKSAIGKLRDILDEFIKNAREKLKNFAKKIRDMFWTWISNIHDALVAFISASLRAVSSFFAAPVVGVYGIHSSNCSHDL